jgi:putative hydrolase of the HAD superfamily
MVQAVLFDLDNTLYPASAAMESFIIRRMNEYTGRFLGISTEDAAKLRREQTPRYGTTLEWLMAEHGLVDSDDYFAWVHPDGEEELIDQDPALGPFLDSIRVPKFVFTNAPMEHADRILARLGIAGQFERVFDIRFNALRGKPWAESVDRVMSAIGTEAARTLFVDDMPRYVQGFIDRGGQGVLVDQFDKHPGSGLRTIHSIYELTAYV